MVTVDIDDEYYKKIKEFVSQNSTDFPSIQFVINQQCKRFLLEKKLLKEEK